jgi:hypothetical protein
MRVADAATFLQTARVHAADLVQRLIALPGGPTMALLALHIARAEIVQIASSRVPREQWKILVRELGALQARFDSEAAATAQASKAILTIAGRER